MVVVVAWRVIIGSGSSMVEAMDRIGIVVTQIERWIIESAVNAAISSMGVNVKWRS